MKIFHYLDPENGGVIKIRASRQPSELTKPRNGTWVVREFTEGKWQMPCFPEITWNRLKDLQYLGSVKCVNE